jgi:hypothetical protein
MSVSAERLHDLSATTGFRPVALEKVVRLGEVVADVSRHPLLGRAPVLKGGTALNLRLVNAGAAALVGIPGRLGYPVCLVCGQSRSPLSSQAERDRFAQDHRERCGQPVQPTGFFADVVADALSLSGCASRSEAYSLLEALRSGAAQVLEMERDDLEILGVGHAGTDEVDALLYDPLPGGSGLLEQLAARFDEVVAAARDLVDACPSACERACIDCLFTFRNAYFHAELDRVLASARIAEWGGTLEPSHELPPKLPQAAPTGRRVPVNAAEAQLRRLLLRAGFPEGEWQREIALGPGLGRTQPDCFFPGEDADDPGVCVYLDGLSEHLHGNPTTASRDRQIREELRARGFEVLEIAATDLWDREKMSRHFFRLGRWLLGRDRAREVRDRTDWFEEADARAGVSAGPEAAGTPAQPFRIVAGDPASR